MQITELAIHCFLLFACLTVVFLVHFCSYSGSFWCCYCLDRSQTNM